MDLWSVQSPRSNGKHCACSVTAAGFAWYEAVTTERPFIDGYEAVGAVGFAHVAVLCLEGWRKTPLSYLLCLDE